MKQTDGTNIMPVKEIQPLLSSKYIDFLRGLYSETTIDGKERKLTELINAGAVKKDSIVVTQFTNWDFDENTILYSGVNIAGEYSFLHNGQEFIGTRDYIDSVIFNVWEVMAQNQIDSDLENEFRR